MTDQEMREYQTRIAGIERELGKLRQQIIYLEKWINDIDLRV